MDGSAVDYLSVLSPSGQYRSDCGYCHGKRGNSAAYGAQIEQMTVLDYAAACDAGWRRSGSFMYHPERQTCCPSLTIRLDTAAYVANASQNKIMRHFNSFVAGFSNKVAQETISDTVNGAAIGSDDVSTATASALSAAPLGGDAAATASATPSIGLLDEILRDIACASYPGATNAIRSRKSPLVQPLRVTDLTAVVPALDHVPTHTSAIAMLIVAALRRTGDVVPSVELVADAIAAGATSLCRVRGLDIALSPSRASGFISIVIAQASRSTPPSNGDIVNSYSDGAASKPPMSARRNSERARVASSSSTETTAPAMPSMLRSNDGTLPRKRMTIVATPVQRHSWRVVVAPATEVDPESAALYARYQAAVHGDAPEECTVERYARFLCRSPLSHTPFQDVAALSQATQLPVARAVRRNVVVPLRQGDRVLAAALQRCVSHAGEAWRNGEGASLGLPIVAQNTVSGGGVSGANVARGDAQGGMPTPLEYHGFRAGSQHISPDMPGGSCATSGLASAWSPVAAAAASVAPHTQSFTVRGSQSGESQGGAADLVKYGYGSFHHRYYLDGALIAVGVVDVLPHGLSSGMLAPSKTCLRRAKHACVNSQANGSLDGVATSQIGHLLQCTLSTNRPSLGGACSLVTSLHCEKFNGCKMRRAYRPDCAGII